MVGCGGGYLPRHLGHQDPLYLIGPGTAFQRCPLAHCHSNFALVFTYVFERQRPPRFFALQSAAMTGTDGVAPVRACGALSGAIACNSVQDQGAFSGSLDGTQLGTQCDVVQSSTTQYTKAGEGTRTPNLQLGRLTLYH